MLNSEGTARADEVIASLRAKASPFREVGLDDTENAEEPHKKEERKRSRKGKRKKITPCVGSLTSNYIQPFRPRGY